MTHDAGHSTVDHSHAHGDHGIAKYVYVFLALCVLTGCSFFTYSSLWPWHEQPAVGRFFMMAVSCTKAMLVILFFMHLKYEADWKYVLTIPASIMSVFLMMALVPDIGLRMRTYSPERREHAAQPEAEFAKLQQKVKQLEPVRDTSEKEPAAAAPH
ncbi:MAG TPA: cytochrome C oxidase subunit IV family protein [Pirellulales bacterium]|jgi:cytochrome c oxidase subunit 4